MRHPGARCIVPLPGIARSSLFGHRTLRTADRPADNVQARWVSVLTFVGMLKSLLRGRNEESR